MRVDLEHVAVADRGSDLDMGEAVEGEIGEIEGFEMLLGIERDRAVDGDVVAEDLEVLEIGRTVLELHDVELQRCGAALRLGPAHIAENELGLGQVGLHAHALRTLGVAGNRKGYGQRPLQEMRTLRPSASRAGSSSVVLILIGGWRSSGS